MIKTRFSSPDNALVARFIRDLTLDRNIVLLVREWKTDALMKLRLIHDVTLSVLDSQNVVSASVSDNSDEVLYVAALESGNSQTTTAAFGTKIARLFNRPGIRDALAY